MRDIHIKYPNSRKLRCGDGRKGSLPPPPPPAPCIYGSDNDYYFYYYFWLFSDFLGPTWKIFSFGNYMEDIRYENMYFGFLTLSQNMARFDKDLFIGSHKDLIAANDSQTHNCKI